MLHKNKSNTNEVLILRISIKFEILFQELLNKYSLNKFIELINIFDSMNTTTKKYYCDIICKKKYNNTFYWLLYKFTDHVKLQLDTTLFNNLYIYYLFQIVYREDYTKTRNYVEDITLNDILNKLSGFVKKDILNDYFIDIFKNYIINTINYINILNITTDGNKYNTIYKVIYANINKVIYANINKVIYNTYIPLLSLFNINDNIVYYNTLINILYKAFTDKDNHTLFLIKSYTDAYYYSNDYDNIYSIININSLDHLNNYLKFINNVISDRYYIIHNKIQIYYSISTQDYSNINIIKYYNYINSSTFFYLKILKLLPEFKNIINTGIDNIFNKLSEYHKIVDIKINHISEIYN